MKRIFKQMLIISMFCGLIHGCTAERKLITKTAQDVDAKNEDVKQGQNYRFAQSTLKGRSYTIAQIYDGGNPLVSASLSVDINDKTRNEYSNIILQGTVKEVESYAKDGAIKSDVYLSVEKVLKNETDLEIGDEISFYTHQGIVPRYEYADSLREDFRKDFDGNHYSQEQMEELVAHLDTGDIIYEIGMTGILFLCYIDGSDRILQTFPTECVLLKVDEDTYISPNDYKYLYKSSLNIEYKNHAEDYSEDLSADSDDVFLATEDVEEFTGLQISD